jgi:hypothetical protein
MSTPQGVTLAAFAFSEDDGTRTRNHRIDRHAPNKRFSQQKYCY